MTSRAVRAFIVALSAALLASFVVVGAAAADAPAAAQTCVPCHGEGGNKPIAAYPKLGGQERGYLSHALRAYKSGKRANAIMAAQVANLSDADIDALSAYFAAQPGDLRFSDAE